MIDIKEVQKHLNNQKIDGWLMYDFKGSNFLIYQFLKMSMSKRGSRRFFYWIPKNGNPIKIVSAIEPFILDEYPGEKIIYNSWKHLHEILNNTLLNSKKVAMEYSKNCDIPIASTVDGGTVELIKQFGVEVVTSSLLLLYFTSVLDENQKKSHFDACDLLVDILSDTWKWIGKNIKEDKSITEYDVQQKILNDIESNGCITGEEVHPPNCSVNENSANPHYEPTKQNSIQLKKGDFVLIDLWCKKNTKGAVFGDITRVAIIDEKPTQKQIEIHKIVRQSQKDAIDLLKKRFLEKKEVYGFEIDDACRNYITEKGYGKYFIHRTGHSIDTSMHGSGAYMDNIESHDNRLILPMTCFSVEPGIYLPGEFGIRQESDVFIDDDGKVIVTGGHQDEITTIL
jgi:Xaa-Pro dipeptidase